MSTLWALKQKGFTIVELLIVIVVIAILAAISIVAFNGVQERAKINKAAADGQTFLKAVMAAREGKASVLKDITGVTYTASGCATQPAGTDLAAVPKTDACWTRYAATLQKISDAGGVDITGLVDPWGRPYMIDENEGESSSCNKDVFAVYAIPLNGTAGYLGTSRISIPLSGFSGCST